MFPLGLERRGIDEQRQRRQRRALAYFVVLALRRRDALATASRRRRAADARRRSSENASCGLSSWQAFHAFIVEIACGILRGGTRSKPSDAGVHLGRPSKLHSSHERPYQELRGRDGGSDLRSKVRALFLASAWCDVLTDPPPGTLCKPAKSPARYTH